MKFDKKCENWFWMSSEDYTGPIFSKTLPAPVLQTGSGVVRQKAGAWPAGRLLQPAALQRWGFIVIEPGARGQADYAGIISLIKNCGSELGMTVEQPVVQQFYLQFRDLTNILDKCKEKEIKLLFVVLPAGERDYYHKVKQLAERQVGIMTQCIKEQTARKGINPQLIKSILLKVNSKLMGVNQALEPRRMPSCLRGPERVMVVGGHVTHQSPEQSSLYRSSVPTIAAVTASFDPQCTKYNVTMSVQAAEKEEIVDFENMMVEHFMVYSRHNRGGMPTTIIYFRSCMPATLYNEVESRELKALYAAFWRTAQPLNPQYDPTTCPKVLFMVVESQRNARLGTVDWGPTWKNQKSTRPGIVIYDYPTENFKQTSNFSMVSHQAIGDARFSNYFIFFNDGVPYVELDRLTYCLCHLSGRGARSGSRPTALHYARLACRRALSLTYCKIYNPIRLAKGPVRLRVHKSLLEDGRMFFI